MATHEIKGKLEEIASASDFPAQSARLVEAWRSDGAGLEAVEAILRFIEEHPRVDFGAPGPLVHFVERFYGSGYEQLLIESIERKPTYLTAWMLNRLINGTQQPSLRRQLISAMEQAACNPLADGSARQILRQFLERLRHSTGTAMPEPSEDP